MAPIVYTILVALQFSTWTYHIIFYKMTHSTPMLFEKKYIYLASKKNEVDNLNCPQKKN